MTSADPIETYRSLRANGTLGRHSYLHVRGKEAEIGWAPIEHAVAAGDRAPDQVRAVVDEIAQQAARHRRRAVGYIAFDAVDQRGGLGLEGAPQNLAELMIAGETIQLPIDRTATHAQPATSGATLRPAVEIDEQSYADSVRKAVATLTQGELQRVVVSRHRRFDVDYDPLDLFATYCLATDCEDAWLLELGDTTVILASPELLLSSTRKHLVSNPLNGTRPRGADKASDDAIRRELLADSREVAEHVQCVKAVLAEIESVSEAGSAGITRLLDVHRQPTVQHLSSIVSGRLANGVRALDAFWAVFPGVTVTGLPKGPALGLLRRLEGQSRGIYGGAVGWVAGPDDCRFSLAIRGIFLHQGRSFLHAGAGIVAASNPEAEALETRLKLSSMERALLVASSRR